MPCMCGDICCSSCGPAQGNSQCPVCGAWASEGGCENPEVCEQKAEAQAEADYAADLQWEKDHAAEIAAAIRGGG